MATELDINKLNKEFNTVFQDFGFFTTGESDILGYDDLILNYQEKMKQLEKIIIPLLMNLMKNPQVDYIKWPNRQPILEEKIKEILAITRDDSKK